MHQYPRCRAWSPQLSLGSLRMKHWRTRTKYCEMSLPKRVQSLLFVSSGLLELRNADDFNTFGLDVKICILGMDLVQSHRCVAFRCFLSFAESTAVETEHP